MVFPLETTINYSCECYIHGSTFYLFFVLPKMEASNFESIFECISYGVNKVLVLVVGTKERRLVVELALSVGAQLVTGFLL